MRVIQPYQLEDLTYWKLGHSFFGRPDMFVYSYLLDGLLIDTGLKWVGGDFVKMLSNYEVEQIFVTHHHEDHSANIELIKKAKDVQAYGSALCCQLLKAPPRVEPARWMTWGQNKPADIIPVDIADGVITSSLNFSLHHTPGHAADHLCLFLKERGWLFSGDLFINDRINTFMKNEKIEEQIFSIRQVLQLDFDVLLCCHQPILSKGKDKLRKKLQYLEDFYGKVERYYLDGMSVSEILHALKWKEKTMIKFLSLGQLSSANMIRSTIASIDANLKVL